MAIIALLDTGMGMTSISETPTRQQHRRAYRSVTEPCRGQARVQTLVKKVRAVEHRTVPLWLTLKTSWGNTRFQLPFVILPGPDSVDIPAQATLGEVSGWT